jgi:G3E family GTPase
VILLNKTDLLNEEDIAELYGVLRKLNPAAKILKTAFSKVPLSEILNTKSFDFEEASQSAGWIKELNEEHTPETEEYGISSFVYRRQKPFHPERFMNWLENWPADVVRAKGFFWIATRNDTTGLLSQAGTSIMIQGAGEWVASYSEEEQKQTLTEEPELLERWDETFGDRMTELVFIGIDLSKDEVETSLDGCLMTDEEMASDWSVLKDPLPAFS